MDTQPSIDSHAPLVEIKDVDRRFFRERLAEFLPTEIVDVHTHVWRASDFPAPINDPRVVSWPGRVAGQCTIEELKETYRLMLPGRRVTPLIFSQVPVAGTIDRGNAYVADCSRSSGVPALIFSHPAWSAGELEDRMQAGGFVGAKSYLSLAPSHITGDNVRILDFFPPHQLEVHNRRGSIVMLHIPRSGRLKDPVNLADLVQIDRQYPNLRLIVAHVGRAYCNHDVGDALNVLGQSRHLCFDISANTNDWVFEQLLRAVGPKRVLFGSDMPIERMRMRRITQGDHYVNVVPMGLYGDVSNDKNMAEADGAEADEITFFLYEQLDAFRRAAGRAGLSADEVADVLCNNARRLIDGARG